MSLIIRWILNTVALLLDSLLAPHAASAPTASLTPASSS